MKPAGSSIDERQVFDLLPEIEPMAVQDIRDALIVREGELFLLTDRNGQMPHGNACGYGLYHRDTRYLSSYELVFSSARPVMLLSTAELGYGSEQVLTNPAMADADGRRVARGTIEVRRRRVLRDVMEERLSIVNHNVFSIRLELVLRLAADFKDIFEVRGYAVRRRGQFQGPDYEDGVIRLMYKGIDGRTRGLEVVLEPEPVSVRAHGDVIFVTYTLDIEPQQASKLAAVFALDGQTARPDAETRFHEVEATYVRWRDEATCVASDNHLFNSVIDRCIRDLRMLWNQPPAGRGYIAAGTPWYDAVFGRDTAIVGLQTLAFNPRIAKECLATLAQRQGTAFDSWREEEPGKILHEERHGELTVAGDLPFSPYFGSVDSTPLFLMLAGEYLRWTGDVAFLAELRPNLDAALQWIERHSGPDGDGYLRYGMSSPGGLVNQGWKDSGDAMVHEDGSLIMPPIALAEAQGYMYGALRRGAEVFSALGAASRAAELRRRASALRMCFNRDFWLRDRSCFAMAIGGDGQPTRAVASNCGHALWAGIAHPEKARLTGARLMEEDMYSGWGVRTLSRMCRRFNPQGYHLGTIWPHDNSIISMGMKRYGLDDGVCQIAGGLLEAARTFEYHRLPELFGGDPRSEYGTPVPYPVACRPQAWAAGAFLLITQAFLGLCPDARSGTLYVVNPVLPQFLSWIEVRELRCGEGQVSMLFTRRGPRTRVKVKSVSGDVQVKFRKSWPQRLL